MSLDCKQPVGNGVSAPEMAISKGSPAPKTVPTTSPMPQGASTENLSAKFKVPRVSQDTPEAGRHQYEY